ncbi:MAG TPA: hypothetical protein VH969_10515, partial [Actinophytocola sp.]
IINDGVNDGPDDGADDGAPANAAKGSGNGITNLSERVAAMHGEICVERLPGDRFRLHASMPLAHEGGGGSATTSQRPWRFGSHRHGSAR